MPVQPKTRVAIRQAFADRQAGEDVAKILDNLSSTRQAAVTGITVTWTANNPNYTPTGALTIADGTTPTVAELQKLCLELRAKVNALSAVLTAHGITS